MLNRLRRSPYDTAPYRRSPAVPDPLIHSRSVARPLLAAWTAVFTDGELLLDLPPGLDPSLRDLFGETSVLEGDFTQGLRTARDDQQSIWGDALGRLAASDEKVWAEIQRTQDRRPWVRTDGRTVRFGRELQRDCAYEIRTVIDVDPGMAALGIVHDLLAGECRFRYWVVAQHAFLAQVIWAYAGGRLPGRNLRCLRGSPTDVLRDLAGREHRTVDLVIWNSPALLLADTLRQIRRLLRPQGTLLLGQTETPLPTREADGYTIERTASDGSHHYLWMTCL